MTRPQPSSHPIVHRRRLARPLLLPGLVAAVVTSAAALATAAWVVWRSEPRVEEFSGQSMGSSYAVTALLPHSATRTEFERAITASLEKADRLMSTYRPDSDLGRLNCAQPGEWVPIADETARVMGQAIAIGRRSAGAYDVTVGALVNLWGFGPAASAESPPTAQQIAAAQARSGLDKLEVRLAPAAARVKVPGVRVDLSSIAKGFAVDKVAEALEQLGSGDYCVEVGGEIRTRGRNPRGQPWQVAVEVPQDTTRAAQRIVPLSGQGMATSGDYRNYFEERGIRYCHILDPRTGSPIQHNLASVTVIAKTCAQADAWATALLVLGPEEGLAVAQREGLAAFFLVRGAQGFDEDWTPQFEPFR